MSQPQDLEKDYQSAWLESEESGDEAAWQVTAADGLTGTC